MTDPKYPLPQDEASRIEASNTITASGNTAALDQGVGFAAGLVGMPVAFVLNVSALVGTGTYTVKLQESADNSTWSDVSATFTIAATGVYAFGTFVTKRYQRLVYTLGGTSPSITKESFLNRNVV